MNEEEPPPPTLERHPAATYMSPPLAPGPAAAPGEEKWVQTDPVTIIIGDSSFLLQQLANINKSPEAVTTAQLPRRRPGRPPGNASN